MDARDPDSTKSLYVHLARDGGIYLIRGDTGKDAWVTRDHLVEELDRVKALGGLLLYSRDDPDRDPPKIVFDTFQSIVDAALPMQLLEEPHPAVAGGFKDNATTLMMASHSGAIELVRDLIQRGAELEARDTDGYTALMYAANMGRENVVEELLQAGAKVNATDNQRSTPVMFAAQHDHVGVVEKMIAAGADLSLRGDHGLTALGFAKQNRHRKTRRILEQAGAIE